MPNEQIREDIYSELSGVLTDFEQRIAGGGDFIGGEEELYNMLVQIQNDWDNITEQREFKT